MEENSAEIKRKMVRFELANFNLEIRSADCLVEYNKLISSLANFFIWFLILIQINNNKLK